MVDVVQTRATLSDRAMICRSVLLSLTLFGSLLPAGEMIQAAAAVLAMPFVGHELLRWLPRFHIVLGMSLLVFGVLAAPGILMPIGDGYGHQKFLDLMTVTLFTALAASLVRDQEHLRVFAMTWVIFGVVIAAEALLGHAGTGGIAGRAVGFGANPIGLARAIGSAVVALAWLVSRRAWRSSVVLVVAPVLLLGLFATGSRAPTLAAILGVAVVAAMDPRARLLRMGKIALVGVAVFFAVHSVDFLANSRLGEFLASPTDVADPVRQAALERSLMVIRANPEGVGYGNWAAAANYRGMDYPHNIWLELTSEAGWLTGAILVLITAAVSVRLAASRRDTNAAVALAWIAFEVICGSASGDIRSRTFFFFLLLGCQVLVLRGPGSRSVPGSRIVAGEP